MNGVNLIKLAFLDTNALVALFTFWEACQIANVPLSAVSDWNTLRQELANATTSIVSALNREDFEPVRKGHQCFQRLDASKTDFEFLCCQVSRSELHHVLLSATAAEELHRHRVPRSLANKRPLMVHQIALHSNSYTVIESQIDNFFEDMSAIYSIDIKILEDSSQSHYVPSETVFETARKIWSHILMETMDSYILAAAIVAGAHCLVTSDGALRKTVNGLQQGQGDWQQAASAVTAALGGIPPTSLPKGLGLNCPLT